MVGSRTSASADFIRGVTCAISANAPESFCTASISAPQYVPVTNGVAVSVRIYSDPFPYEVSWRITDLSGLAVYASVGFGSIDGDHAFTDVLLSPGGSYIFTIMDAADDGIFGDVDATLYEVVLVDQGVNMVLLEGNGAFTSNRSETFSVPVVADYPVVSSSSSSVTVDAAVLAGRVTTTVKIYILFADYHEDLSWMVTDASDENVVYASVPPDHYRYGKDVQEEIQLPAGLFSFVIRDRRGTDDFRAFTAFSVSYVNAGGDTVPLLEHLGAIAGESKTQTFEIPASAMGSSSSGTSVVLEPNESTTNTDLCLALYVPCQEATDCCSGRCANGQCRSTGRERERESLRIGRASAGGAASRASAETGK
jgi:hypothetical protein